jgi:uncharacterized protein YbaA (DUF1428 family)
MRYVDGFVIPIPTKNIEAYKKMAKLGGKVWKEYGALEYMECILEDGKAEGCLPFAKLTGTKKNETVVFSFIVFKSRKHRDQVNAKVMKDPRMDPEKYKKEKMPFDVAKMAYGGFETIVDL